ncbi:MAG: hypothetical protein AABZ67_00265, partial [Pseudomonadota bacterium]
MFQKPWAVGECVTENRKLAREPNRASRASFTIYHNKKANFAGSPSSKLGGVDGTRTRDPRRDRPV